jgi:hypothetical protein
MTDIGTAGTADGRPAKRSDAGRRYSPFTCRVGLTRTKGEIMEKLHLARVNYLLDRVSNNVKYPTLDGSPALPAEAAELIECLGKLGLVEAADAMRKDFIVYFAHEVRLPNTGLDPRLVAFRSKANELFGPFPKYSRPEGDGKVVRLRLIDHFDGLQITFKKLSMYSSPLTPPAPGTEAAKGKASSTLTKKNRRRRKPDRKVAERRAERTKQAKIDTAIFADWRKEGWGTYQQYATWKNEYLPAGWPKLDRSYVTLAIGREKARLKRLNEWPPK